MLAIIGFLMVVVIIYCLMESKATPAPIFVVTPIVAAIAAGFTFPQISGFIKSGVAITMPIAVLFIFSIIYFSVMSDVGLFDPFVNFLVKKAGNNVVAITVTTALVATIAHLDGALASTLLVTVPAMLPLYKRLNIRPQVLLVIIGAAAINAIVAPWFVRRRPAALSAAYNGASVGGVWPVASSRGHHGACVRPSPDVRPASHGPDSVGSGAGRRRRCGGHGRSVGRGSSGSDSRARRTRPCPSSR